MSDGILEALHWPLFTIDFEASSLAPGSYPIEVGICRWAAPDAPLEGWSSLIRPAPPWRETGSWTAEAEAVHGICRDEFEGGLDPTRSCRSLTGPSAHAPPSAMAVPRISVGCAVSCWRPAS